MDLRNLTEFDGKVDNPSSDNNNPPNNNKIKFNPNDQFYDMSGKKYLLIFNHFKYQKTKYFNYEDIAVRNGTAEDVKALRKSFEELKFHVVVHHDLTHNEIIQVISEVCSEDHTNTSCIFVAVLTHGEDKGIVFAADKPYKLSDITLPFTRGHDTLVGKPKVFLVQACRGANLDDGRTIETDGDDDEKPTSYLLPSHADCVTYYSTIEDYLSLRNSYGSFLIQEFCKVLDEHNQSLDILQIITLANKAVAYNRTSYTSSKATNNKKQMPEAKFTLTKFFKFN